MTCNEHTVCAHQLLLTITESHFIAVSKNRVMCSTMRRIVSLDVPF